MPPKSSVQQYILLPSQGMQAYAGHPSPTPAGEFLMKLSSHVMTFAGMPFRLPERKSVELNILDSVHEDGAKLVELASGSLSDLRAQHPGLRLVPIVYYHTAVAPRPAIASGPQVAASTAAVKITLKIVSRKDGSPVAGAFVVAFTDFSEGIGAQGKTNSKGEVRFSFGKSSRKLERLYVYPDKGYWPLLKKNIVIASGKEIGLNAIGLGYKDSLRHFYGNSPDDAGAGIRVGVIDTGIAAHPDLVIDGGENTVVGEKAGDFGDNGHGHGTHVAGIVAARGIPPSGIRGVAPAVILRSYRVFGKGSDGASNYAIAKAIDRAVADGCDLLNMSLGGGPSDEATMDAIADARARGSLVIAAAGNDGREPVCFPASDSLAQAVSALGRKGTWPAGSTQSGNVAKPYGKDKKNFIADFSNIGPELDLTAPGVGIISTYPGGYAVMDGTSMACPAATGIAAKLLAAHPEIAGMARNQERSDAMAQLLLQAAKSLGFGPKYEGQGLAK
ncbi:MAG: S8 family serine peptidase [Acidobacteria bacterium]|nr:S8 family serine peptidase [Acidobacteriota bacterium]